MVTASRFSGQLHPVPGRWDGLIVLCAANNWDAVKLADRHMAESLVKHSPVLYVDPPLSHLTPRHHPELRPSIRRPRLRLVQPGLARLTPVVLPRPMRPEMTRLTNRVVRRHLTSAVRCLQADVRAVVTTWLLLDVFGACGEQQRAFWWQDDPAAGAALWGGDSNRLLSGADRVPRKSDLVVAVSETAVDSYRRMGLEAAFLPNGCDVAHFAETEGQERAQLDLTPPVAISVGHLNSRVDLALLEAVVDRGMSLLLVGPVDPAFADRRFQSLVARPNVRWLGSQPYEALPALFHACDVGLVPYPDTAFNTSSFPMKTLEYLSAGLPVVATPLPAIRWLASDLVAQAAEPPGFAAAAQQMALTSSDPAIRAARRALAAEHTWNRRASQFLELLEALPGRRSEGRS